MFYLHKQEFIPQTVGISILFIPAIIAMIIGLILDFQIYLLIILVLIVIGYVFLVILFKKLSKNKSHYLILHSNTMEIRYPNINNFTNELIINYNEVIELQYYRLFSIKGILASFHSFVPTMSVFIKYKNNDKIVVECIGHISIKDIKKIAQKYGIPLKIY